MGLPHYAPGRSQARVAASGLGVSLPLLVISLALLLLVSLICLFAWSEYIKWADQTRVSVAAMAGLKNVVSWLERAETSQQAYLLTGDNRYLKEGTRAGIAVDVQLNNLDTLNDRRGQVLSSLKEFRGAVKKKLSDLDTSLTLIHENNPAAAIESIKAVRGRLLMDHVRSIEIDLEQGEQDRLVAARSRSRFYARLSQIISTFGSAGIFAIVLISTIRIRRLNKARTTLTEELQRTNEDLRQFVYSASHDLQEPLRNLMIYSDLIEKRMASGALEAVREDAKFIRLFANRMRALVADLLAYTQVASADPAPLAFADMNRVLAKVLESCDATIAEAQAKVTSESLPRLRISEAYAEQLLQNLLSNAIKYRQAGVAARIHVSAARNRQEWIISVKDNGIGIDPHYHAHIFGIFKRLHTATEYPGTGLGLAICRKIVERQGGRIWVESQAGKGSTFHFSIPGGTSSNKE